jgi:AAA15 family ATPase/GTPase
MLTAIHLLNFKSFFDQKLSLAPMTLLAGLNNSGKSSIIQALRMMWTWSEIDDHTEHIRIADEIFIEYNKMLSGEPFNGTFI